MTNALCYECDEEDCKELGEFPGAGVVTALQKTLENRSSKSMYKKKRSRKTNLFAIIKITENRNSKDDPFATHDSPLSTTRSNFGSHPYPKKPQLHRGGSPVSAIVFREVVLEEVRLRSNT